MVSNSDTSNAEEEHNFTLTPLCPGGENNRQLFISLLVSVEELLREIKQALQLEHNKLAQRWEGFQGSMLCDKAITSWLTGTASILFFYSTLLSTECMNITLLKAPKKLFAALECTPSLHIPMLSYCSGTFPFHTFLFLFFFFSCKGMCFILHNRSWHTARSLVLSSPIFLGEIWCFCRQECMLNASRWSHYSLLFL